MKEQHNFDEMFGNNKGVCELRHGFGGKIFDIGARFGFCFQLSKQFGPDLIRGVNFGSCSHCDIKKYLIGRDHRTDL